MSAIKHSARADCPARKTVNKIQRNKSNPGIGYEGIVAAIHRQFSGNAVVTENEIIIGKSGRERQIDVTLRTKIAGYDLLVIIECKDYKRRVEIGKVDELIGKLDDVGAAKGILVSDSGFAIGAVERAKADKRIQLSSVIDTANGKLRSRIHLPISFHHHVIEQPFNFSLEFVMSKSQRFDSEHLSEPERMEMTNYELKLISEDQIIGFVKEFFDWYEMNNRGPFLSKGYHEFIAKIVENEVTIITGKVTFNKGVRIFVNENIYLRGVGIYEHTTKSIIEGDNELNSIHLDRDEIFATWREVDEKHILKDGNIRYYFVGYYDSEAVKDHGQQFFAAIKSAIT